MCVQACLDTSKLAEACKSQGFDNLHKAAQSLAKLHKAQLKVGHRQPVRAFIAKPDPSKSAQQLDVWMEHLDGT